MSDVHNHQQQIQPILLSDTNKQSRVLKLIDSFLLIFVTLKLAHMITWPWIFVLAPAWLPVLAVVVVGLSGKALRGFLRKRLRNRW